SGVGVESQRNCPAVKHGNRKNYNVIVECRKKTVSGYCCECPNGNRTVGCCSHVPSILWYLGLARYDTTQLNTPSNSYIDYFKDVNEVSDLSSTHDDDDDNDVLYSLM
ncbi:unnamed protein product, partial [Didymodactylos carnosus]